MARSDFGRRAIAPQEDRSRGTGRASKPLGEHLLDDGSDRFNSVCTRIAIVMLGGLLAIYLETVL